MKKIIEKVDIKKIIKDLIDNEWTKNDEDALKNVQLLKGLATSDSKAAKKFIKAISDFTSKLDPEEFKEKKESVKIEGKYRLNIIFDGSIWTIEDLTGRIIDTGDKSYVIEILRQAGAEYTSDGFSVDSMILDIESIGDPDGFQVYGNRRAFKR